MPNPFVAFLATMVAPSAAISVAPLSRNADAPSWPCNRWQAVPPVAAAAAANMDPGRNPCFQRPPRAPVIPARRPAAQVPMTPARRFGSANNGTSKKTATLLRNETSGGSEAKFDGNNSGACLKFMHIPKTGGTSIDSTNFHLQRRAFGSLMELTYDRIAGHMNLDWDDEANLYDTTHANLKGYIPFVAMHALEYHWVPVRPMTMCQDLHTPPHLDPTVARYFKNSCGTFCTVRNPVDRYLSGYKMHSIGPCTAEGFERAAETHIAGIQNNPFIIDCHFAPQVMFVFGAASKAKSTYQYCNHILKTETLDEDFHALMVEYNRQDVFISKNRMFDHSDCKLTSNQISRTVKQKIYALYRHDFEAFGYPKPS